MVPQRFGEAVVLLLDCVMQELEHYEWINFSVDGTVI
jgi:hypothetical protein